MGQVAAKFRSFEKALFKPASIYPLVALRLAFGLAMSLWSSYMIFSGKVAEVYSLQVVHFHLIV